MFDHLKGGFHADIELDSSKTSNVMVQFLITDPNKKPQIPRYSYLRICGKNPPSQRLPPEACLRENHLINLRIKLNLLNYKLCALPGFQHIFEYHLKGKPAVLNFPDIV